MVLIEEDEYKGNPMLILKAFETDKYPFRFGVKKAHMILECIDEIKEFVEKYYKE